MYDIYMILNYCNLQSIHLISNKSEKSILILHVKILLHDMYTGLSKVLFNTCQKSINYCMLLPNRNLVNNFSHKRN